MHVGPTAAAALLDRSRLTAADVARFGREFGLVPGLVSPAELMQVRAGEEGESRAIGGV